MRDAQVVARFCLYSIFKNLRFFEPFFIVYLLAGPAVGGPQLSYLEVGALIGAQKGLTALLEIPLGVLTDRCGRRRALIACFVCYAVAFPIYAVASALGPQLQLAGLVLAQGAFGVGEALRTGSHKAIMLDWAAQTQAWDPTRLLAVTRFFSKSSAGLSALLGAAILYATGSFSPVFWAATLPAFAGVLLMLSYPRWLEGEQSRRAAAQPERRWRTQLAALRGSPGMLSLMFQSVFFESQVKLAQHYIQPLLKAGLDQRSVAVAGGAGALAIGVYYLAQDLLGGVASASAVVAERRLGGGPRALERLYAALLAVGVVIALSISDGVGLAALLGFVALALLQNLRRPIFVAQLERVMDKPQRATTLSIESQARSLSVAALVPLTGWLADHAGLAWTLSAVSGFGLCGALALRLHGGSAARGLLRAAAPPLRRPE